MGHGPCLQRGPPSQAQLLPREGSVCGSVYFSAGIFLAPVPSSAGNFQMSTELDCRFGFASSISFTYPQCGTLSVF